MVLISQSETASKGDGLDAVAVMPRKLTRSLSARVSRLATISRPAHTDTDSEADEKQHNGIKKLVLFVSWMLEV